MNKTLILAFSAALVSPAAAEVTATSTITLMYAERAVQWAQAQPQPPAPAQPPAKELQQPKEQQQSPKPDVSAQQPAQKDQAASAEQKLDIVASPGPHILASDLRGTRVRGADDENIGDVNDILIDRDGRVMALIIGVGGFLGIGQKDVAVPLEAVEIRRDDRSGRTGATTQADGRADQVKTKDVAVNQRQTTTTTTARQAGDKTTTINPDVIILRGMTREDLDRAPAFRADRQR